MLALRRPGEVRAVCTMGNDPWPGAEGGATAEGGAPAEASRVGPVLPAVDRGAWVVESGLAAVAGRVRSIVDASVCPSRAVLVPAVASVLVKAEVIATAGVLASALGAAVPGVCGAVPAVPGPAPSTGMVADPASPPIDPADPTSPSKGVELSPDSSIPDRCSEASGSTGAPDPAAPAAPGAAVAGVVGAESAVGAVLLPRGGVVASVAAVEAPEGVPEGVPVDDAAEGVPVEGVLPRLDRPVLRWATGRVPSTSGMVPVARWAGNGMLRDVPGRFTAARLTAAAAVEVPGAVLPAKEVLGLELLAALLAVPVPALPAAPAPPSAAFALSVLAGEVARVASGFPDDGPVLSEPAPDLADGPPAAGGSGSEPAR